MVPVPVPSPPPAPAPDPGARKRTGSGSGPGAGLGTGSGTGSGTGTGTGSGTDHDRDRTNARAILMPAREVRRPVEPAVVARDLVKRYEKVEAVRGVSFDVPRGSVFAFLGPNGAGKSTTMKMLYGLSPRTSGTLEVLGLDVATRGREVKARIGVVPQESNLDTDMTARENLVVYGRFFDIGGRTLRDRCDELLEHLQLTDKADERVFELSGGLKRRLLIARALVNDPELLILDEPTTGLDPQSRALLWERIRELRRGGKTVLLTTHYMKEAEKLADELVILDEGRIIERDC